MERSNSSQQRAGNFKITSGISKPRHVFVFIINDANIDNQTTNPFLYNTFSVSTDPRSLLNCHLQVGNGNKYPEIHYTPSSDITRVYRDVLNYTHSNNDFQGGTLLKRSNFSTIFPFLYFDLTKQKMDIKDGTTKLTFKYELSGTTATAYSVYAVTLYEQDIELQQKDGKLLLRLNKNELTGNDELMLNRTQLNRIKKAMNNGTGVDIKISKTQIRKAVKHGGSLWSSLISMGTKLLPYATKAVSKAVPALATGALSALGSLGIDKIFGKGQTGGFLIPQNKVNQLIQYKDWLTTSQKKQILDALQTGGQVVIKPTKTQQGGFLGALLASIGVPLLLNALTGKGLQVDRNRSRRSLPVYVPPTIQKSKGGLINPYAHPPPFFWNMEKSNWNGTTNQKKKAPKNAKGKKARDCY